MRYAKSAVLAILIILIAGLFSSPAHAGVSFSYFQSNLSSHGSWFVSAQYGQVWQPDVYSTSWNPYYDGHWAYSDLGCTWVSDYSWGAIPYHYGTWVLDPALGWVWVPGYVWAPSWVVFRTGPDYIGWAPVSPHFSVGVSFSSGEPATGGFVFVSSRDFLAPRIRTYVVPESRTKVIINRTTVVNNIRVEKNVVVNRGPDVAMIEKASGRKVRAVPIEQVARVAPGPRVSRSQLNVDPQVARRGLKAAEPERGKKPMKPSTKARGDGARRVSYQKRDPTPPVFSSARRTAPAPRLSSLPARAVEAHAVNRQPAGSHGAPRAASSSNASARRPAADSSVRTNRKRAPKERPARKLPSSSHHPGGEAP